MHEDSFATSTVCMGTDNVLEFAGVTDAITLVSGTTDLIRFYQGTEVTLFEQSHRPFHVMRGWLLKPVPLFDNYKKKQNCHIKMLGLLSYNTHVRIFVDLKALKL